MTESVQTFIVDCPSCNAKVAAIEKGRAEESGWDLQTFVYAIVEYVYDLADRYEEFKRRTSARSQRKKS